LPHTGFGLTRRLLLGGPDGALYHSAGWSDVFHVAVRGWRTLGMGPCCPPRPKPWEWDPLAGRYQLSARSKGTGPVRSSAEPTPECRIHQCSPPLDQADGTDVLTATFLLTCVKQGIAGDRWPLPDMLRSQTGPMIRPPISFGDTKPARGSDGGQPYSPKCSRLATAPSRHSHPSWVWCQAI
jgi:hypothetical protein